jgi:regulatory protein YycI of two-component signal transduction system YycFG
MDWSKAKTYLILTFFLLDLLLAFQYYTVRNVDAGSVPSFAEQVAEVKELLQNRHLVLDANVPRETPELGFLRVRYVQADPKQAASKFLQNPRPLDPPSAHPTWVQFQGDRGTFTFQGPGQFVYDLAPMPLRVPPADDLQMFDRLYADIGQFVWNPFAYVGDRVTRQGSGETVEYVQMYENYPIFSAAIRVTVENQLAVRIQQSALEVLGEEGSKKAVLSAVGALRSLAESMDKSALPDHNKRIREIKLGFYSKPFLTDSWYLAPMWRITTDEDVYYVNAMTGEVETVR